MTANTATTYTTLRRIRDVAHIAQIKDSVPDSQKGLSNRSDKKRP